MKKHYYLAAALAAVAGLTGCEDVTSSSQPVAAAASEPPDVLTDDGDATASLSPQSALDDVSRATEASPTNRWAWVEDPDSLVTLPQGVRLLKDNTETFDWMNKQFLAEEFDVACRRLDQESVESVAGGPGWVDYGNDYWSLLVVAAPVSCVEHESSVNRWVDRS